MKSSWRNIENAQAVSFKDGRAETGGNVSDFNIDE